MLRFLFPGLILTAVIVAGCGGGGGGNGAVVPSTPVPAPSATISPGPTPQAVTLTGAGYTLQFTLPASFSGGGNLTATLQASPPSGVPAPTLKRRNSTNATKAVKSPDTVGSTPTAMVYLVVQASGTVQFTSIPSFVFTLPHGVSIPSGSPSYVAFYDPTQQQQNSGWIGVLGPGAISGQTDTFEGVGSGVTLVGGQSYVYALVYTTQAVPTATPAPTPTPVVTPSPTVSPVAGTVPLTIVNNNTSIPSSSINFYIYGQDNTSGAWEYVTASGSTVAIPNAGATVAPIPWSGSGNTSQALYLPPLTSGRVYVYDGTPGTGAFVVGKAGAGPNPPAPWAGTDGSANTYFDFVEYSYNGSPLSFDIDTSQVDAFGLALRMDLYGSKGNPQSTGFLSGAVTQLASMLKTSPTNPVAWTTLTTQMPYRVLNPGHMTSNLSFLDAPLLSQWNNYQNGKWMTMTGSWLSATGYTQNAYGTVDSSGNFNWYAQPNTSSAYLGSLPAFSNFTTTVSQQVLAGNGAFVQVTPDPNNGALMPKIGDYVAAALNRGVMSNATQPDCTQGDYYLQTGYQNQFAAYLHQLAAQAQYGFNQAYAFSYDDACGYSTNISDPSPTKVIVTINPS